MPVQVNKVLGHEFAGRVRVMDGEGRPCSATSLLSAAVALAPRCLGQHIT